MIFNATKLSGVFEIRLDRKPDERGFFARTWCQKEFDDQGLNSNLAQCSVSFNARKGTLRGLHYQAEPHPEAKVVRCTAGALYDVIVDLRRDSPTFKHWVAIVLNAKERNMAYVPQGCAHGFLTLEEETEVFYQMSELYHPELARGVRWNDPIFEIAWPTDVKVISETDRTYPNFEPLRCAC